MNTQEIECRFLEIDKAALIKKLKALSAEDEGEKMFQEVIIYDNALTWRDEGKKIRIRDEGDKIKVAYKENKEQTIDSTIEIEFGIDDFKKAELFFETIGFVSYRRQQKIRHSFHYKGVTIDIDTWPRIPTYVELEGDSEESIKKVAEELGFDWKDVVVKPPRWVIEEIYKIPVSTMKWFTFDRFE